MFKSSDVPYNPCLLSLVAKASPGKLYIVAWCPYDGLGPEVLTRQMSTILQCQWLSVYISGIQPYPSMVKHCPKPLTNRFSSHAIRIRRFMIVMFSPQLSIAFIWNTGSAQRILALRISLWLWDQNYAGAIILIIWYGGKWPPVFLIEFSNRSPLLSVTIKCSIDKSL